MTCIDVSFAGHIWKQLTLWVVELNNVDNKEDIYVLFVIDVKQIYNMDLIYVIFAYQMKIDPVVTNVIKISN